MPQGFGECLEPDIEHSIKLVQYKPGEAIEPNCYQN